MPSITTWNRLEPRPRSKDINDSLAARLRDPLWLLARQWQMGEFQGEDAGSPAFALVTSSSARPSSWGVTGSAAQPLTEGPLESVLTREELDDSDLSLAVELGQTFVALLAQYGALAAEHVFRQAFPISAIAHGDDPETVSLRNVCAGRAIDGITLFRRASVVPDTLPSGVTLTGSEATAATKALSLFVRHVRNLYGAMDGQDPTAWQPERLRYQAELRSPAGEKSLVLSATPDRTGGFDWYAFDITAGAISTTSPQTRPMMPAHASFRGMPNARFWDFEDGVTDFGAVRPDRRDLSRLMLVEFMLLHANDWFVIPFEQDVGTFVRIDNLVVHDVFGGTTVIPRAGSMDSSGLGQWSMFANTADTTASGLMDCLFLPAAATGARQTGDIVEEVRFLRDETANMAWGVEHTISSRLGTPRPGHELATENRPDLPPPPRGDGQVRYRIQTTVPRNWIPFVPVQIDMPSGQIALELAVTLGGTSTLTVNPPEPAGRLLKPAATRGQPYRIREEAVPRSGVRVLRVPSLTRWLDGSTYLWWARHHSAGAGEGSSGLRFDVAETSERLPP